MSPPASSYKRKNKSNRIARRVRVLILLVLAIAILPGMIWDDEEQYSVRIAVTVKSDVDSDAVILALADSEPAAIADAVLSSASETRAQPDASETCPVEGTLTLSLIELPPPSINLTPLLTMPQAGQGMLDAMGVMLANIGSGSADLISYARHKLMADFGAAYRDLLRRIAIAGLRRIQDDAALAHATIMGTVSTYNPFRGGREEGSAQTASGELYDPAAWTAAIKTELRNQFRGVRHGKLYQPAFALVESGDKQLIVKINDVGPLRAGRVLDLNERSMRHFDPGLTRGLIQDVKITLLPGEDWTPGPVGSEYAIDLPTGEWRAASAQLELIESASRIADPETLPLLAPAVHIPDFSVGEDLRAEITQGGGG
jgi:peptidoglycan lytic transglycosylase